MLKNEHTHTAFLPSRHVFIFLTIQRNCIENTIISLYKSRARLLRAFFSHGKNCLVDSLFVVPVDDVLCLSTASTACISEDCSCSGWLAVVNAYKRSINQILHIHLLTTSKIARGHVFLRCCYYYNLACHVLINGDNRGLRGANIKTQA